VLAAAAWADGRFSHEVTDAALPDRGVALAHDNTVRARSKLEAYARLRPVRRRRHGHRRQQLAAHRRRGGGAAHVGGARPRAGA
jgi:hypothetical protein